LDVTDLPEADVISTNDAVDAVVASRGTSSSTSSNDTRRRVSRDSNNKQRNEQRGSLWSDDRDNGYKPRDKNHKYKTYNDLRAAASSNGSGVVDTSSSSSPRANTSVPSNGRNIRTNEFGDEIIDK
jgi:hypothetical protein